ncbi:MAG TPA: prolyl oligopeptidase family serine peptidase [Candidatus Saccharimonadales bacterium]|nr:prolyl oligopeptidase family serine peptidase [Candidatus Saccharimonadales bacterium]
MIFSVKQLGSGDKLVLFYIGWRGELKTYNYPIKKLVNAGFKVIAYEYESGVLTPNIEATLKNAKAILDDSLRKIEENKSATQIATFGTSYGTLIASLVAKKSPKVSKVILNLAGDWLGDTVWSWDRTNKDFKDELIKDGVSKIQLHSAWATISSAYQSEKLKDKDVLLYVAKNDHVIPYDRGIALARDLKKGGANVILKTNRFGHMVSIIVNLARSKTYLDFLQK